MIFLCMFNIAPKELVYWSKWKKGLATATLPPQKQTRKSRKIIYILLIHVVILWLFILQNFDFRDPGTEFLTWLWPSICHGDHILLLWSWLPWIKLNSMLTSSTYAVNVLTEDFFVSTFYTRYGCKHASLVWMSNIL